MAGLWPSHSAGTVSDVTTVVESMLSLMVVNGLSQSTLPAHKYTMADGDNMFTYKRSREG